MIRAEAVRVKAEAFVESAKVIGASTPRVMFRHVLRNSTRTLPLIFTLNSSEAILTLAGLGFLGFGIEPTSAAEWGYDLNRSISDVTSGIWWTSIFPGLAIVLLVLGITLIGESLNDLADPRLRGAAPRGRRDAGGRRRPATQPDRPRRAGRGALMADGSTARAGRRHPGSRRHLRDRRRRRPRGARRHPAGRAGRGARDRRRVRQRQDRHRAHDPRPPARDREHRRRRHPGGADDVVSISASRHARAARHATPR